MNFSRSVDFWCEENGIQKVSLNLLDVDFLCGLHVGIWGIPRKPQTFKSAASQPPGSPPKKQGIPSKIVFLMDGNGENKHASQGLESSN